MPNKEERKHFLKKRKETSTKKGGKTEHPSISKSIHDVIEISNFEGKSKTTFAEKQYENVLKPTFIPLSNESCDIYSPSQDTISQHKHCQGRILTAKEQIHNITESPSDKPRSSKSQGTKFFFFPFFKKNSDNQPPSSTKQYDQRNLLKNISKQRSLSTHDSSESSNASLNSNGSHFSASQYLYSTRQSNIDTKCTDCSTSYSKVRRNSCNSSSFIIKNMTNKVNYDQDLRPNSIAFPLPPPPESTINHPTCEDSSIRHSIAAMPHHYKESSQGSFGIYEIGNFAVQSAHYVDKCISYPSLENHHLWNAINPSHPDYPQIAKNIMYCSRSQYSGNSRYFYSEDYKRKSLPSDGDSGVALDHHKRSMVFSGYNSLLSVEPSNPNLSISTTSDCEPLQIDETSSRSSYELENPTTTNPCLSPGKSCRCYNSSEFYSMTPCTQTARHSLCTTTLSHYHPTQPNYVHPFFSQKNLQDVYFFPYKISQQKFPNFDDITPFFATQESYYNSMNELSCEKFSTHENIPVPELISGIGKSGCSNHHFTQLFDNVTKNPPECSMNNKPRRAKSLKDPSCKDDIPYFSHLPNCSPTHGRDISFYTYIAPDPNHSKEIPNWLADYSKEESILQFYWQDCKVDDLICWITLLGRLYKKELESIIQKYENTRDDLIKTIEERSEELVEERIALENALISEETYV